LCIEAEATTLSQIAPDADWQWERGLVIYALDIGLARANRAERGCVARAYPIEVREEAIRVARNRKSGVTIEQVARGFGVHPMTLQGWLRQERDGRGAPAERRRIESSELRDARVRILQLEEENQALRQATALLSRANLIVR